MNYQRGQNMPCRMIYECRYCKLPCIHIVYRDTTINSIPEKVFTSDLEALTGVCCLHGISKWELLYSEDCDE